MKSTTAAMTPDLSYDLETNLEETKDYIPPPQVSESKTVDESAIFRKRYFPSLRDAEIIQDYKAIQRRHLDIVSLLPLAFLYFLNAILRFNLQNLKTSSNLHILGFTLLTAFATLFGLFDCAHVLIFNSKKKCQTKLYYHLCERFLFHWFGGRIEDVLSILCTCVVGVNLIARVYVGQCPANISIWNSQPCNTLADAASIPTEQVIVLFLTPIGCQIVMRGLSVNALIFCWLATTGFVLYPILYVGGGPELWTAIYVVAPMVISFEVERLLRQSFIQSRETLRAEKLQLQMEVDASIATMSNLHKVEILKVTSENDKKLREAESLQLRSLMGNVAHDLKTPLHSIEADMEVLRVFFSRIPSNILAAIGDEYKATCAGEIMDPLSVFNSLNSTCKFMGMAINRSQDFMKASSNIALVPAMETFEFESAVAMSVTCINHLQTTRTIIVHPTDTRICSHIISDKHWLSENVLCLLSNAIKYSDGGVIELRIELVEVDCNDGTSLKHGITSRIRARRADGGSDSETDVSDSYSSVRCSIDKRCSVTSEFTSKSLVLLTVEDMGIGISKKVRKNLFQAFKQAQRMAGGTGLGLYSLSKRIDALGGSYGVSSRSDGGQGSMFWIAFPYRPDDTAILAATLEARGGDRTPLSVASDTELHLPPLRILVVDDSISVLKVTSRLLKMNGHIVETASNGYVGLERLKRALDTDDFDMVLTDLQMPVMDGIEAATRFRKFESDWLDRRMSESDSELRGGRLMYVGMSANADDESRQEALDSGMDYFITKPFAYKDLAKILVKHRAIKNCAVKLVAFLSSSNLNSEQKAVDGS